MAKGSKLRNSVLRASKALAGKNMTSRHQRRAIAALRAKAAK